MGELHADNGGMMFHAHSEWVNPSDYVIGEPRTDAPISVAAHDNGKRGYNAKVIDKPPELGVE